MKTAPLILMTALATLSTQLKAENVYVYAAASLTDVFNQIGQRYQQQYPQQKVIFVYGASSTLAKQINAGAKADVFFSADRDWMQYLVKQQKIAQIQVKTALQNDLVVVSPKNRSIDFKPSKDFKFAQSFKGKLCTGQMESVPAGKYAKQSLTYFNWLNDLQGRIVGADDVRAALTFVERGECDVGIVYKTDALMSKKVKIVGQFPTYSHPAILYPVALTTVGENNKDAVHFYQFLLQDKMTKQLFSRYGFKTLY